MEAWGEGKPENHTPPPIAGAPRESLADLPAGGNRGKLQPTAPSQACRGERSKDVAREHQTLKVRKDGDVPGVRYPMPAFLSSVSEFVQSQHREKGLN